MRNSDSKVPIEERPNRSFARIAMPACNSFNGKPKATRFFREIDRHEYRGNQVCHGRVGRAIADRNVEYINPSSAGSTSQSAAAARLLCSPTGAR
jgi:hypothetical protein